MDLREMPASIQGRHPWEQSRAQFFLGRLASHLNPGTRVLDIGAGDGYLASRLVPALQPGGAVVCCDVSYTDEHIAKFSANDEAMINFTRQLPKAKFDVVLLLDVIEHVAKDRDFLTSIVRNRLEPGGLLLASVPAHPWLFTKHDASLGHYRRYSMGQLKDLLVSAGLVVEVSGGLFHSLLPLRAAQKLGELMRGVRTQPSQSLPPDHADTALANWRAPRWVTATLLGLFGFDNWISHKCAHARFTLPGLSSWALARKP